MPSFAIVWTTCALDDTFSIFASNRQSATPIKFLAPVVQKVASAIQWINRYPLDNSIGFASVYPVDSDLSGG